MFFLGKLKDGPNQSYQLLRHKIIFISAKLAGYMVTFYNFCFLISSLLKTVNYIIIRYMHNLLNLKNIIRLLK